MLHKILGIKTFIVLLILAVPSFCLAGWTQPVWTDDCTTVVTKDAKGRRLTWTETCLGEDGKQTSKRVDTYTYDKDGVNTEVNHKNMDSKDKITAERNIQYKGGKAIVIPAQVEVVR